MKNRKNIIIAAAIAILGTSFNTAFAENNNLVQMDVKRSSVADTVDVTFYTTSETANSVVTRKSSNRYVVLLPNTASSASVAPGFGAVKDLITDIDVKHVNDGMGGYTKVTFGTTKPINIKTHITKTAPLSQAQKDARALIAKNNTTAAEPKPAVNTTPAKQQTAQPVKQNIKNTTSQNSALPKIIAVDFPKSKIANTAQKPVNKKAEPAKIVEKTQKTTTKPTAAKTPAATANPAGNYVPKMKYDNNGKRIIDLEPRVSHSIVTENAPVQTQNVNPEPETIVTPEVYNETTTAEAVETPVSDSKSSGFPYWVLFVSGGAAIFGILFLMFDAARHSAKKDKSRLDSFFNISAQNHVKRRKKEYYEIVNNEELNWQEKYKLYNEKEDANKPQKHIAAMSYVTDMSGLKKNTNLSNEKLSPEQLAEKNHKEVVNEKVKAKMLELEKSYNAPSAQKEISPEPKVHSEDDVILKSFNEIKLKSFSKPMSLKESQRTLVNNDKNESRNKSYKEGKFVKLKTSTQNLSEQNKLVTSDLINTGDKYLPKKEVKMSKERENYLVSSVDEYLSILDTEKPDITEMSAVKIPTAEAMVRSGVSNPIASTYSRLPKTAAAPEKRVDGLVVKSGYNIDANRGFFVVNIDGVSAIVGKIKDNIFVLKKFDRVIDNPIQVRRDDGNVYIVKLGKYKCLVNVEQDKMGTLIEI